MTTWAAIEALFEDPRGFLKDNWVKLFDSTLSSTPIHTSQDYIFRISPLEEGEHFEQYFSDKVLLKAGLKKWKVRVLDDHPGRTLTAGKADEIWGTPYEEFRALYLPTYVPLKPGYSRITLSGQDGPRLLLTKQVSDCHFDIGSQEAKGCCVVSHTRSGPVVVKDKDSLDIQAILETPLGIDISRDSAGVPQAATIFGHRTEEGVWEFYQQELEGRLDADLEIKPLPSQESSEP